MTWTAATAAWPSSDAASAGLAPSTIASIGLIAGELLSRGHRFPRRAMQLAALLLGNDEDHPITLASIL